MKCRLRPSRLRCCGLMMVVLAVGATWVNAAEWHGRPLSARGESARTLIVFSAERPTYSLGGELELLKLQLQRVTTRLETVPWSSATSNQVSAADYLVLFHPQPGDFNLEAGPLLQAFGTRSGPSMWVGHGADQLARFTSLTNVFEPAPAMGTPLGSVSFRGRPWTLGEESWIPVRLAPTSNAEVLIHGTPDPARNARPVAWKRGNAIFFSALPSAGPLGYLFSDLVLDFYQVSNSPASRIILRVDDYQPTSNHREFRRAIDYLFSRRIPFALAVTPSWRNPPSGDIKDLNSTPDYVSGLRYAQQRGGRIVLRGCVREADDRAEFWDTELDRPRPDDPSLPAKLSQAVQLLLKHGLLPLAWQTPQNSASHTSYRQVAQVFSTGLERLQLTDLTHLAQGNLSTLTVDRFGRQIIPENLVSVVGTESNRFDKTRRDAESITSLSGTVAGGVIHAYQPFDTWVGLIETLEGLKTPFLDLAELDHWVQSSGALILTGNSQRTVKFGAGTITSKVFDRAGRLIAAEQESAIAGERLFQRRGRGDYEVLEFIEARP